MKKKIIFAFLFLISFKLFAQYTEVEKLEVYQTTITLCSYKNKSYVLIQNGYEEISQSLVIFPDKNYTARQVFGEILHAYYCVKNDNKILQEYNGENFYTYRDNSENEKKFLRNLTNTYFLKQYKSFYFIDNNYSKDEDVTFLDFDYEEKQDDIGSSAGILMGINSEDFVELINECKMESK